MIKPYYGTQANGMKITKSKNLFSSVINKYQRYIKFALVGGTGYLVNLVILYCLTEYTGLWYIGSAIIGIVVANTSNYFINHNWAFRNEKRNNKNLVTGWIKYMVTVGISSLIYLGLLALLTEIFGIWYIASSVMAVFVSSVISFLAVRKIVWGKAK